MLGPHIIVWVSFKALIKRERKSSQVFACASFDRQHAAACVSLRLIVELVQISPQVFFQLARACESFEHKTQADAKSFLPARALELAEVGEL